MRKITLKGFGLFGVVLFIPLFILTFADAQLIEKSSKSFIEWKLNSEVENKIDSIKLPQNSRIEKLLAKKAKVLQQETENKLAELKNKLKNNASEILSKEIAKMLNLDCECRKKWETNLNHSIQLNILSLEKAQASLIDFSQMKYIEIVQKLTIDVRIFLGVNAVIFALLFIISLLKPQAIRHLFFPGILMFISTIICSYFYLFEQNWFYTIIYNDYTGFSFLGYLLIVFLILCDIALNKAKITTEILNGLFQAIGQATSFTPC